MIELKSLRIIIICSPWSLKLFASVPLFLLGVRAATQHRDGLLANYATNTRSIAESSNYVAACTRQSAELILDAGNRHTQFKARAFTILRWRQTRRAAGFFHSLAHDCEAQSSAA